MEQPLKLDSRDTKASHHPLGIAQQSGAPFLANQHRGTIEKLTKPHRRFRHAEGLQTRNVHSDCGTGAPVKATEYELIRIPLPNCVQETHLDIYGFASTNLSSNI